MKRSPFNGEYTTSRAVYSVGLFQKSHSYSFHNMALKILSNALDFISMIKLNEEIFRKEPFRVTNAPVTPPFGNDQQ
jgi:hypothetical protein